MVVSSILSMKILWFTWKDKKNPQAGGAEIINEEIAKRLVRGGHQVKILTAGFPGRRHKEKIDGYEIIRCGNRWSVYSRSFRYYAKHLIGWPDLIIEEINTFPFCTQFYAKEKRILLFYQLCREIWFYQMKFPFSLFGYLIEPIYLRWLNKNRAITISNSSKKDLLRYGFKSSNIKIMPVGIEIEPLENLKSMIKYDDFTMLSLGAIREMKRPDEQVRAFEIAKEKIPALKLKIAGGGSGKYFAKVMRMIKQSKYRDDIEYLGKVSIKKKTELMQKCHFIAVTSVKEGWGLIVTEAASQGTPAIVYNVDGLRDSVRNKITGLIARKNTPEGLAEKIIELYQKDRRHYRTMQKNAWSFSKEINFANCFKNFDKIISEYDIQSDQGTTMKKNPLISVIVPTLNSEKFLSRCLDSVKRQSYKNIEIIVVDNNSIDKTKKIARRYTTKIYNRGPERSAQVNFGVSKARGEYVYKIDSDFVLDKKVVEECVEKAAKGYDAVVVHNSPDIQISWIAKIRKFEVDMYKYEITFSSARFVKKSVYKKINGFNEKITAGEDYDFQNKLNRAGVKTGFIEAEALHLGEPKSFWKHMIKYYTYGKDFANFHVANKKESKEQLGFFRGPYLKNWKKFLYHPILGGSFIFYNICKFSFGGAGFLVAKIKPKSMAKE